MNNMLNQSVRRIAGTGLLCLLALSCGSPAAQARTITVGLDFGRLKFSTIDPNYQGQTYYTVNVSVSSDLPPVTYDEVVSPIPAYSGSESGSGRTFFNDLSSALNPMTNGAWTLTVNKGDVSEKQYTFTVTASGLSTNNFPAVQITTPADGSLAVATNTPFSWSGPASWNELFLRNHNLNYSFDAADFPSPATTSWNTAPPMPLGTNEFEVNYSTNGAPWFTLSTPVNNLSQPFTNWVGGSKLFVSVQSGFVTSTNPAVTAVGGGHTLVAHYAFDSNGNPGQDTSGNGNDLNGSSSWGLNQVHVFSTDAAAGGGAVQFFGESSLTPSDSTRTNWDLTLAGSFSMSAWVKTTASRGNDYDNAYFGATIFWAFNDHNGTNDTIPLAITGSKAAFTTRDHLGNFNTLHSATTVNNGSYHLLTVTRNQATGEKKIYVDGNFETSEIGTTDPLNGNDYYLSIGGSLLSSYTGLLDDVQFYSGVLSASEVAALHNTPGSTAPDVIGGASLGDAVNAPQLTWTTGGDLPWFVETTNTHDNVSAAQSGAITDNQQSWSETTVAGPGSLTFWWKVSSEQNFDYLEFLIDGVWQDELSGDSGWQQQTYSIGSGPHTLRWHYYKDGSGSGGLDAGFLDQVSYNQNAVTAPVITLNPFSQTNYPGYNVALLTAVTNVPVTWQWFKVGVVPPIPSATNTLYIPTNSGTASVAGGYFAIATSASSASATTTVATVTFQSAPLPPDWSRAFKTPLSNAATDTTTNYSIACLLDSTGNLYTVGSITGTNTFGSDTLTTRNSSFETCFLKQTATGTPLWGRSMTNNGNGNSYPRCITAAPGNGFYASGYFSGTNWLGTNLLVDIAGGSTWLARFDANGSNLWVRTIVGTNFNYTTHHTLVSDPAGNVTMSVSISGYTSFGTTNLNAQQGVLVQYDPNGNVRWLQVPSGWPDYLTYNGGRIYGTMDGNPTNYIGGVTNVSDRRRALFSINVTNGQAIWLRVFAAQQGQGSPGGFGDDLALVTVSGTNLFVVGSAWGTNVVFGPISLNFPGAIGQFFARYDTDGNAQLATSFGSQFTWPWAARADASGNVYVGGDFDTYSIFGGKIIAAPFYETVQFAATIDYRIPGQSFISKFDRNGNPLWARLAKSDSSYANTRDIVLAPDGVWSCGFFNPIATFGTNTVYGGVTIIGSPIGIVQYHLSGYLAKVTDSVAVGLPVALLTPQNNGANFQFQFLSQAGFTHAVLYRTNLVAGNNWQTYSNVTGDGTLKTIPIPLSLFSPAKQGFVRVSTQ